MSLSRLNNPDTIAAIASAHGQGAVGVLRISGSDAFCVLKKIFAPRRENFESHKMYYGKIRSNETKIIDDVIDEVMVCFFAAPRSFTREDCVEIYAHGGMFVLGEILGIVIKNGARLAEPGEFTQRAFLNGRINLAEAEAVMDLISAKTSAARRAAVRQLGGGLSQKIQTARDTILSWLAHIELSIDYPEHEDEARNAAEILAECGDLLETLRRLHATSRTGRIIRDGIRTAIIGRPNVGKSTLLNAILHEDRAIVHETAGTTRDALTEQVRIGEIALSLTDTAGLRQTTDPIEKIGIEKTRSAAHDAELILYVADATVGLTAEDVEIINDFDQPVIILMNKSDLKTARRALPNENFFEGNTPPAKSGAASAADRTVGAGSAREGSGETFFPKKVPPEVLKISAKTGDGLENLFRRIEEKFIADGVGEGAEAEIITRERHEVLLARAIGCVEQAERELGAGVPEDLVSVPLRAAYLALGEILGVEIGDDIVDRIFAEFCLGK
ncbi:MAG: tRNA uridine-5-carboxymethylaminomethyl(34) synthesis GTPase MnmE [Defluviitaleaceae bacterium]|nr:tRNA uridine-5-carboxymethylaminomethyl(34) synthesis GTPase MnmE [Defluviitaleaceae bacterium]